MHAVCSDHESSLSLPSVVTSHPVRFLYGAAVTPPTDPEQILTDRIEQWCAKQQAQHQAFDSRLVDLRVQTLQELDRGILALQLLTQSNWGPGQNFRFMDVRPSTMEKDISLLAPLQPVISGLINEVERQAAAAEASLKRSSGFAAVISALRDFWPIEERDNRVFVDLLPLSWLVRAESPYFCTLTARLDEGVCVIANPDLSHHLQNRLTLRVVTRGFTNPPHKRKTRNALLPGCPVEGRANLIHQVLGEFQDLCLDHAVFEKIREEASRGEGVDRRRWTTTVTANSVLLVCLADPSNIRTIKIDMTPGDERNAGLEVMLRRVYVEKGKMLSWLLDLV